MTTKIPSLDIIKRNTAYEIMEHIDKIYWKLPWNDWRYDYSEQLYHNIKDFIKNNY